MRERQWLELAKHHMMRVLRADDYRHMPWKNGGGATIEMIVSPDGASFDAFDWRISMARVATPGSFSLFPGIDRTLSVIAGNGLSLRLDDKIMALDRSSDPFRFSGDAQVNSILVDGAIDDLNVMTRRGQCDHRVIRHALTEPTTLHRQGDVGIVVTIGGVIDLRVGHDTATLAATEAVLLDAEDAREMIAAPHGETEVFVVEIWNAT